MATNRHVVDQLADVRAIKSQAEADEKVLKAKVSAQMGADEALGGDEFIATQSIGERKNGLDEAAMKAVGIDIEKYRKPPSVVVTIRTERRVRDELGAG